jgi:hypothetical protein
MDAQILAAAKVRMLQKLNLLIKIILKDGNKRFLLF